MELGETQEELSDVLAGSDNERDTVQPSLCHQHLPEGTTVLPVLYALFSH